ncbi:TRAP transporter substrate-binding protein [uncultured Propionivibrio sp.]|uniref:TRAP transporter substrate-binding protein n=1 Tax=uncultured Propionivibrio sp. TaxID=426737 RepID=UPI0029C02533|nr:TRAP transporter substrate-binding protein [uncultured Propionivibrio sp.]
MKHRMLWKCAVLAVAVCTTGGALAQKATFKAADVHPNGYPTVEAVKSLGAKLEAETKGRLKVRMYAGGVLGDEKSTLEQTQAGAIQFQRMSLGALGPVVPEVNVFNMPFVFRDVTHMRKVIDGPIGDEILRKITDSQARLVALAFMDSGSRSVYSNRPVRTPGDLRGLKIRMMGNPLFVETMNAMGGSGVSMGSGEVYSAMQTGLIDGAENNEPTYWTHNHYSVVRVYSRTEHLILPEILVFSKAAWNKLSPDDQQRIRRLAREAQFEARALWDERVRKDTESLKAKGISFVDDVDKKAFIAATEPVREKYGRPYADLIRRIQDVN